MISDMDILREMIKENAREDLQYDDQGKPLVILREREVKGSNITIEDLPADALVIKVDAFEQPASVFKGKNGECSRADYAIISEMAKCVIYIEMKRKKDKDGEKPIQQLKGAQCFITYCREVGRLFWGKENFLTSYKNRFIYIVHTGLSKRQARPDQKRRRYDAPDNPNNPLRIGKAQTLQFRDFAWL